jgi:hypothetical protein
MSVAAIIDKQGRYFTLNPISVNHARKLQKRKKGFMREIQIGDMT